MKFSGVKKISAAAIAAMMLVAGMTACGSSDSTGTADSGTANGTDVKKIGIIQLVEHDYVIYTIQKFRRESTI